MKPIAAACAAILAASPAFADGHDTKIKAYVQSSISPWLSDPSLIQAVKAQNAKTSGLSQTQIDTLDQTWRAEVGSGDSPTIDAVLENTASAFLRDRLASSNGVISEIFAMDARGLNVAASGITSDYWQGDEDKFRQTFPNGPNAIFIDAVEFDESSQTYQAQVSVTLADPATGLAIGAITIGMNAETLF